MAAFEKLGAVNGPGLPPLLKSYWSIKLSHTFVLMPRFPSRDLTCFSLLLRAKPTRFSGGSCETRPPNTRLLQAFRVFRQRSGTCPSLESRDSTALISFIWTDARSQPLIATGSFCYPTFTDPLLAAVAAAGRFKAILPL